jgi:hypothetical protein
MFCKYTAQGQYVCEKTETKSKTNPIQIEHFASCRTGCTNSEWYNPFTLANKQKVNIAKICKNCQKEGDVSIANCTCPSINEQTGKYELKTMKKFPVPKECRNGGFVNYNDNTNMMECKTTPKGYGMCDGYPNVGEKQIEFELRTDCFENDDDRRRAQQLLKRQQEAAKKGK